MKERPILFSTPMVQALLAGRKTQTRRVITPQPSWTERWTTSAQNGHGTRLEYQGFQWKKHHVDDLEKDTSKLVWLCPYGKPGDILWVRETFGRNELDTKFPYRYKTTDGEDLFCKGVIKWKPSIHMPKEAARIFLRVKSVRVEKAQSISEEDAIAEGIERIEEGEGLLKYRSYVVEKDKQIIPCFPYVSFRTLWHSINGRESWEANPWVWVITFSVIKKP